jgi:protein ImuB
MAARSRTRRVALLRPDPTHTRDLFAPEPYTVEASPVPPTPRRVESAARPAHLWLAVRFAQLARVALRDPAGVEAVIDGAPGRQRVVAVSSAAAERGVSVGLTRAAAEIRVPALQLSERRPTWEARALQERARQAFALTPFVSPEAPDTLLLEVRGSVRLFGGLQSLVHEAQQRLGTEQIPAGVAVAPSVWAALWLVRANPGTLIESLAELPSALARVPLGATGWDEAILETCERLGVATVGELARLPRDGVARRLSPAIPLRLDEALGRAPQPRRRHVLPERFTEAVELPAELIATGALQPWCERLLQAQERFLVQRDASVAQCRLRFTHRPGQPPTSLVLERSLPTARAAEWALLLTERLGRTTLTAPVVAVSLRSGAVLPAVPLGGGLVGDGRDSHAAAARLLDRLRARLGESAVHALCLVPEHRPESAFRRVSPTWPVAPRPLDDVPPTPRPLWLLATPEALTVRATRPWYGGPLALLSGPERIESGWWSGQSIARDYYVARASNGARLWIYRERAAASVGAWYLHGVFA